MLDAVIILSVGISAGLINAVAGAGSIVTFPVLVALGYPPVIANASNIVGLIPASITAILGFRRELSGHWRSVTVMAAGSLTGGVIGAVLLVYLPAAAFSIVVPYLLLSAALLAAAQPLVARYIWRHSRPSLRNTTRPLGVGLLAGVFITGVYGGYFGAAQGVILLALLGSLWSTDLVRANGAKNVLAGVAGIIASTILVFTGLVDWEVVLLIGLGGAVGGWLGSRLGRHLPATVLRTILVIIATSAAIVMWIKPPM